MKRTALLIAAGVAVFVALPGCVYVDGSSDLENYKGYGSTTKAQLDTIVASNTQSRIGEPEQAVLGRFPAEHVSLMHSSAGATGETISVYRVFAREKGKGASFERYFVFKNGSLILLTDDEDEIEGHFGYFGEH